MAIGAGKYDDLCTHVREQSKARGVVVLVLEGDKGNGFSCQCDLKIMLALPNLLEELARQIREDQTEITPIQ
jgi:hypothetical protein